MIMEWIKVWTIVLANLIFAVVSYMSSTKNENFCSKILNDTRMHESPHNNTITCDHRDGDHARLKSLKKLVENIALEDHCKEKIIRCIDFEIYYAEYVLKKELGETVMKKMGIIE